MEHLDGTQTTNGAAKIIEFEQPYTVEIGIIGVSPILFHRWNDDSVAAKAKAAKGSKAKKTDDVDSYVYRTKAGHLALPSEYLRQSIIHSAKFAQDPRSPRKSAMDLFKAGVVTLDDLCSLGTDKWDYLDRRRVLVQRSAITRTRPAMLEGWQVKCKLMVLLPEYIGPQFLNDRLSAAGKLIGVGDMRPTYGRFQIIKFDILGQV